MSDASLARYKLLRRIGAGGMAEVFRAELVGAEGVTRELVVKKVRTALAADPAAVAMFVDEARVAARLRHPGVVQVYEFGRAGDDYFLAMELVEGCDLAQLARATQGGLPLGVVAWVMVELLDALAYVHELCDASGAPLGLVHRDVTPHNVLLGREGEVKLADFGIARATAAGALTGEVEGKLAFMAPEQARAEAIDARADQFAAGAVLYALLSGRRPYGEGEGLADRARRGAVTPLREVAPQVPGEVAAVVDRALSPDRDSRFETTRAMLSALRAAFAAAGVTPDREGLRARVAEVARDSLTEAVPAERTLTAAEEHPTSTSPEPPAPTTPRRRFLERVALAAGVLVVAVLAERRTRPVAPARPRAATGAVTLTVALPDDARLARWPDGAASRELIERCRCRPRVVRYRTVVELAEGLRGGAVDVALVEGAPLAALVTTGAVRRLDTALSTVDAEGYVRAARHLRPEMQRLGLSVGAEGEGTWLLPLAADALAVAVRRERLVEAVARFAEREGDVRASLRLAGARALPTGYAPSADPRTWTTWDLVALGAAARRAGAASVWIPSVRARDGMTVWRSRLATRPAESPAAAITAGWDAMLSRAGIARRGHDDEPSPPWSDPSLAVAWVHSSAWSSLAEVEGWTLARPPRGDGWTLDASGDIERVGLRALPARPWGLCMGRGSAHVAAAARWILGVAQAAASEHLARALGATSAIASAPGAATRGYVTSILSEGELTAPEGPASPEAFDASAGLTARALDTVVDPRTPLSLPAIEALFAPATLPGP
ncbi:MAG: serine/threonine-protein kinase [Polyangiales bacterium]